MHTGLAPTSKPLSIGVFDSGLGGLSVLREIARQLPHESLIYLADSLHAPYGEKTPEWIEARTLACCDWLVQQGIKALVVACNTATAHTIAALRSRYPQLALIGVEPGLKPAAKYSQSKVVGVLATQRTLHSEKFNTLLAAQAEYGVRFICQAGVGLVPLVESGEVAGAEAERLLRQYIEPMLAAGADTLVLGCTHYPFLQSTLTRLFGERLRCIDTGHAVARRVAQLLGELEKLGEAGLLAGTPQPTHRFCTTRDAAHMQSMLAHLLNVQQSAETVVIAG